MDANFVHDQLKRYFFGDGWCYIREVRANRGVNVNAIADAIAVSLWPSRGHHLHGIEVKVSRNDWLRELKNPRKSNDVWVQCSTWTLATPPDVVNDGELPIGWGHIVVHEKRPRYKVRPSEKGTPAMTPIAMSIIGQLLKDREGYAKAEAHKRRMAEAKEDAEKYTKLLREHSELRKKLEEAEQHDRDLKTMRRFIDACGMSAWDVTHPNVSHTDAIKAAAAAMQAEDTMRVAIDRFRLMIEQATKAEKLFRSIYEADNSGNAKPAEEPASVRDGLAGSPQASSADN